MDNFCDHFTNSRFNLLENLQIVTFLVAVDSAIVATDNENGIKQNYDIDMLLPLVKRPADDDSVTKWSRHSFH